MKLSREERKYVKDLCNSKTDMDISIELTRIRGEVGIRDSVTIDMVRKARYSMGISKRRGKNHGIKREDKQMELVERLKAVERVENKKEETRLRVIEAAKYAVENYAGVLVEIGCHKGKTTSRLCQLGRQVIAVDPWELGTQNCEGGEREEFLERTKDCGCALEVVRSSSMDEDIMERLRNTKIAFAYVDGLHSVRACSIDIETVSHSPIIGVDDIYNRDTQDPTILKKVFDSAVDKFQKASVASPSWREGFLFDAGAEKIR